jgi:hypothetical protein
MQSHPMGNNTVTSVHLLNVLATFFAYFLFMFFNIGLLLISLALTNLIK